MAYFPLGLILFLIVVAIILPRISMDATIRSIIYVVLLVVCLFAVFDLVGGARLLH